MYLSQLASQLTSVRLDTAEEDTASLSLSQCRNMQTDMNIDIRNMEQVSEYFTTVIHLSLLGQAFQLQRDRAVISGMDNMDISSKDNMDELLVMGDLRAALSDMRLEVEPSMELPPNMPYMEYMMERQAQTNNNKTQFLTSFASHAVNFPHQN